MKPSGWSDDRFMEAYDAIAALIRRHSTPEDKLPEIRLLLAEIEHADSLLSEILRERNAT